ncbi:hypothetical protein KFE94_04840 [bacterium SCSIO 12643]|nr:hypothetical protein KFE94_04840 [bacterium SCSIO 12643]
MKQTLVLFAFISLCISSCIKEEPPVGHPLPEVVIIDEDIVLDTTWKGNKVYQITTNINIRNSATLTIEPGCIIKCDRDVLIKIPEYSNGAIHAVGTNQKNIIFTSSGNRQDYNEWGGIQIFEYYTESVFENCIIEHANHTFSYGGTFSPNIYGGGSLVCLGQYITIKECTFRNGNGVYMCPISKFNSSGIAIGPSSRFTSFINNNFELNVSVPLVIGANSVSTIGEGNKFNPQSVINVQENLNEAGSHNWINPGIPYVLNNYFSIWGVSGNPCTMILEPGTELKCPTGFSVGQNSGSGGLIANGTPENPIIFRGSYAADQNSPRDWNGLSIENLNSDGVVLNHCVVTNGGKYRGNIYIGSSIVTPITISNCEIKNSYKFGIFKEQFATEPILLNNTFKNNASGDKNW